LPTTTSDRENDARPGEKDVITTARNGSTLFFTDSRAGNGGNDSITAADGEADRVDCGQGLDSLSSDRTDTLANCEGATGVLKVAKAGSVDPGAAATIRVAWEHPQSWRKLRMLAIRVVDERGAPVGDVAVRPGAKRVVASGATLRLAKSRVSIDRSGKRAVARIRVRPTAALAGTTLGVDVTATDRAGKRQVAERADVLKIGG
jgi:hypothetical protein